MRVLLPKYPEIWARLYCGACLLSQKGKDSELWPVRSNINTLLMIYTEPGLLKQVVRGATYYGVALYCILYV